MLFMAWVFRGICETFQKLTAPDSGGNTFPKSDDAPQMLARVVVSSAYCRL